MLVLFPVAAGDEGGTRKQPCDEGDLDAACALAAKCALELTKASTGGVHKVEEDGVSAVLRMHCAIGCGSYVLYRVGDRDDGKRDCGEPCSKLPCSPASAGTPLAPGSLAALERKGYRVNKPRRTSVSSDSVRPEATVA